MRVSLIAVPYDLGRADVGSGRGPAAYLKAGAAETLRARGHEVEIVTMKRAAPFTDELQAVLDVDEAVAVAVDEAVFGDSFPLVVAGNCNVTLGVQAGLQRAGDGDAGLVWLDAHGDFNTPATTETGYLDGMPLAMLCGRAYREAVERELEAEPLAEHAIVHAGGREFDREELGSLLSSAVVLVDGAELRDRGPAEALAPALDALAAERRDVAGLEPDDGAAGAPARGPRRARPHGGARRDVPVAARAVRGAVAGGDRPRARALHARRGHGDLLHARPRRGRDHPRRRPRRAAARHDGAGPPAVV